MIAYRQYEDADWQAICQIHDRARPDELAGSCDPRAFVPIEQDPEIEKLITCRKFVAGVDGRVIGFVGVDGQYLAWLYVDPEYYSKGIGRELLRLGLGAIGKGAWTIVLEGNVRAKALYESEGFTEVKRFAAENAGYPCTCLRMERVHPPS